MIKFSILDPIVIAPNSTSTEAMHNAIELAQFAESLDFARYWIVEHHGVHYEATPAPEILAGAILNKTSKIRVGIGGFLLNNYSPYKIAELIKSLNALYPDRLDFGIGHSQSGEIPDFALQANRNNPSHYEHSAALEELLHWLDNNFPKDHPFSTIPIMRDQPRYPNIWAMAVSEPTAIHAAKLGINLACSAFHKPELAINSLNMYRKHYHPARGTGSYAHPKDFLAIRLIIADTQEEAEQLAMPMRYQFHQRRINEIMPFTTPTVEEAIEFAGGVWPAESSDWPMYVIGDKEHVYRTLSNMIELTNVNEIVVQDVLPTLDLRKKMYTQLATLFD